VAPAGAGDRHSVFDEVAAGPLNHAGGDGPAHGQGNAVDVGLFRGEVVNAVFSPGARVPVWVRVLSSSEAGFVRRFGPSGGDLLGGGDGIAWLTVLDDDA
jgi:hypothetical protein